MVTFEADALPKVLALYLEISQYPILAPRIRERMRNELYRRGIISPSDLEREVKHKAILSQKREGLTDPYAQESADVWQRRLAHYRDFLTDFYFAHNLPHDVFENIVRDVLAKRIPPEDVLLTFNPELAPWDMLFAQGETYEALPPEQRDKVKHHLQEIVVVLTKGLISDQLDFVGIAKHLFTIEDLKAIRQRRIGRGKIGGKAAGMMLAYKILSLPESNEEMDLKSRVVIPESYFIGADVVYDFMSQNNLHHLHNQKYLPREEILANYDGIRREFLAGHFPDEIVEGLRAILDRVGNRPLIVRSSSLLEDSVGTSFAGKYDSFFCPNQGTPQENLQALLRAIALVYASVFSPDALFYRQQMGLLDFDERMAILLQEVQGERHGDFFFPTLAGVAFSHNPFRWTTKIRAEDGFLRLVWGLGTRAVDRVANDYPRMVALSHPQLRPEVGADRIRRYSQHFADVINLAENEFQTRPVADLLSMDFPSARLLVSVDRGDYLQPPPAYDPAISSRDLVLTFDNLLTRTSFVPLMKAILRAVSRRFGRHVDMEFTADILPDYPEPDFRIHLLQCRPQASRQDGERVQVPAAVAPEDVLFTADRLVPQGRVRRIRHIVFVDPEAYDRIPDETTRLQVARLVSRLNETLERKRFILMGPGRWGSANLSLGVKVGYADIYNTAMLIEIGLSHGESAPEVSYGTHFFQDLVEAEIYPLALYPDQGDNRFNWAFFRESPNSLADLLPDWAEYERYVRLIDVPAAAGGRLCEVIMDGTRNEALGYLRRYED
ncbi:MAG TPA: phosphoenolpyruvate synthase [Anaerolineae bacterium]|nr:phosphoenolpyruvate synthase [Anaerolineae bacterium]